MESELKSAVSCGKAESVTRKRESEKMKMKSFFLELMNDVRLENSFDGLEDSGCLTLLTIESI
jgi:hypothetical protein